MTAGRYDLILDEGLDLLKEVVLTRPSDTPLVLTGYTGRAAITRWWPPGRQTVCTIGVSIYDATNGILRLSLAWATIAPAALPSNADPFLRRVLLGQWDLVLLSPTGLQEAWLEGDVILSRKATAA